MINDVSAISAEVESLKSSIFQYEHDDNFNLFLRFGETETLKIPVINLRPYQLDLQKVLFGGISKRILIEWPRRSGKEVITWNFLIHAAIIDPGMYIMTYPTNVRARKILWQGAPLINGVSTKFLDMIPKKLIAKKNDADMTIELVNGSIIWIVGCDIDPEKLRGTNPRGLIYSELAFSDPRVVFAMFPVLRENGGWMVGQSTFDGMNHFYRMIKNNMNDPLWYCRIESINTLVDENGNPYITDADVDEDRRGGMPEYLIQQEYYGNVQINEETKYFAIAINKVWESERIISGLILSNKNVYAFYDIGVSDNCAITLAQFENKDGKMWPVVIGYIENNNRALQYYVTEIRSFCNRNNLVFHTHFTPHDGKNRNFNDNLKITNDYLQDMGERGITVNRPSKEKVAIELIRQTLYRTKFNKENCHRLIDCLSSYEKEYDEKMLKFKDKPVHNWASHGVKSYQTMCLALEKGLITETSYDVIYLD
jgi:hypothetical protein